MRAATRGLLTDPRAAARALAALARRLELPGLLEEHAARLAAECADLHLAARNEVMSGATDRPALRAVAARQAAIVALSAERRRAATAAA